MKGHRCTAWKVTLIALGILAAVSRGFAGNPFIWWDGNADPTIRIFNNTAYLYPSHDSSEYDNTWLEDNFKSYSSTDLINWTDNGIVLSPSQVSWATGSTSCWAPDIMYVNGYYYFFFVMNSKIGIGRGTSPSGGFTDYLGKSFVANIDPSCFTAANGNRYLTWGQPPAVGCGSDCFCQLQMDTATMNDSVAKAVGICMPNADSMTEASWIFERNGLYYLLYGTTSNGSIRYGTSTTLGGSSTYRGRVISGYKYCPGTGHGSVFELNGQWYMVSHMCIYDNTYYRKTGIWYLHFFNNGLIDSITTPGTWGVGRYQAFDTLQASEYFNMQGVTQAQCSAAEGGFAIYGIHNGSWVEFPKTNFLNCQDNLTMEARVASADGGTIEIRQGSPTGTVLGTATVPNTGGDSTWQTVSCPLTVAPGSYQSDLYFTFQGAAGDTGQLFACHWFNFTTTDVQPRNAFDEIQAENFDSSASVTTSTAGIIAGSGSITATAPGGYTCYKNVYFGNGAAAVDVRYLSSSKAASRLIELRVDSRTGPILDTVPITDASGTWRAKFVATSSTITGLHNLYLNFLGTAGATNLYQIDMLRFIEANQSAVGVRPRSPASANGIHATSAAKYMLYLPLAGERGSRAAGNPASMVLYSLSGRKIARVSPEKLAGTGLHPGVYIMKNDNPASP
jgi:hypothetical protein